MFDHIGFPTCDLAASRTFYMAALAPVGIEVIVDRAEWAAFGRADRAQFWIGGTLPAPNSVHLAFAAADRAAVGAFYVAVIAAGGQDTGIRGYGPTTIIPTITAHSCSIPMATMSRRFAATPRTE